MSHVRPEKLWELSQSKRSRIIVAIDLPLDPRRLIEEVEDYAVGVKLGLPALLRWGPRLLEELCREYGGGLYMLCDLKLADIPPIVAEEIRLIGGMGFDGAVLHLFPGGVGEAVASLERRPDLFGIAAMSHPQAGLVNAHLAELIAEALGAGLEGCIVPATRPEAIREARRAAPSLTLLAPGVGAQGAEPGSAVRAGADFEIVGRAVTASPNPRDACRRIRDAVNDALGDRGGG